MRVVKRASTRAARRESNLEFPTASQQEMQILMELKMELSVGLVLVACSGQWNRKAINEKVEQTHTYRVSNEKAVSNPKQWLPGRWICLCIDADSPSLTVAC